MYGFPLYNQLVVVPTIFCLLTIIRDIHGYIICTENMMCLQLLLNLKPLQFFFSTLIKQIQIDNGGEFTSNQFKKNFDCTMDIP